MELRRNARGHRVVTIAERMQILSEIESGTMTPAQAARKYELALQTIHRWKLLQSTGLAPHPVSDQRAKLRTDVESVPLSEFKKLQDDYKKLQRILGKVTEEKEILKEAVEIASKKKWISLGS